MDIERLFKSRNLPRGGKDCLNFRVSFTFSLQIYALFCRFLSNIYIRHSARWRLGSCPEVSPKFWRFMGCRKLTFNLNFGMLWCSAFWWWKNNPNILTLFKSEKVKEKNNLYILALFKSAKLKVGKYCSVHVFYCVCIVLFNVNIWDLN